LLAVSGDIGGKMKRAWIFRPSTCFLVLTFGYLYYYLLHNHPKNFHYSSTILPLLVALLIFIRKMEDDSVKGMDEADVEDEAGPEKPSLPKE